jgi:hypothetical protein
MTIAPRDPAIALREATDAAIEAHATLEDAGLRAAFARLQAHYTDQMRRLPPEDRDGREGAYLALRALDALAADLARMIAGEEFIKHNYRSVLRTRERSNT